MDRLTQKRKIIIYVLTILVSALLILVGRSIARTDFPDWGPVEQQSWKAQVTEIISDQTDDNGETVLFYATALSGADKGQTLLIRQRISNNYFRVEAPVEPGDRILYQASPNEESQWLMLESLRSNGLLILAIAFALGLLLFGGFKGLNALVSLTFTCLAVFLVFIPSVFSGKNIYLWSILCCLYIIAMTMMFINGACRKSLAAGMGCFCGVALAGALTAILSHALALTGMTSEEDLYLTMVKTAAPIDLKGIIFAAVIIGAVGAVMDVAMDIASSLHELYTHKPELRPRELIRSGFNIGRDVMGTMANTLVLAYIGSGLCTTLLIVAYHISFFEMMNWSCWWWRSFRDWSAASVFCWPCR